MRFIYTKAFAIFFICLTLLTILVFFQTRGWLDPVRSLVLSAPRPVIYLVKGIGQPVKNFFVTLYQLRGITKENTELRNKIISLEQNLVEYQQQARENETLRKNLGFSQTTKLPLVPCTVLSQNSLGLTDTVILNCGTESGVGVGQAVISEGYLVGKVIYAGKNSSKVSLSTASDFSTDAKISQNNSNAIVEGSYGSGLILDQVPRTSDLEVGWLVVTAGINQKIPKNILIGQVSEIISGNNDLFKKATLSSPIDFNNLKYVFVVKNQ